MKVTKELLSPYCESIGEKFNISIGQVHKLIPTLNEKEKYMLHYRNLHLYTDLGLKVHRVLEFNQSLLLKQYVDSTLKKEFKLKTRSKRLLQTDE